MSSPWIVPLPNGLSCHIGQWHYPLSSPRGGPVRISELGEATGVPVHTLKYYLREGLLMPGRAISPDPRGVRRRARRAGAAGAGARRAGRASRSPACGPSSTRSTPRRPSRHDLSASRPARCPRPPPTTRSTPRRSPSSRTSAGRWRPTPRPSARCPRPCGPRTPPGVGLSPGCCATTPRRCTASPTSTSGGRAHERRPQEALRTVVDRHRDGRPGAGRPAAGGAGGRERPAGLSHTASGPPDATKARSWWTGPSAWVAPTGFEPALPP